MLVSLLLCTSQCVCKPAGALIVACSHPNLKNTHAIIPGRLPLVTHTNKPVLTACTTTTIRLPDYQQPQEYNTNNTSITITIINNNNNSYK